jgi:hypothetical protein
MRRLALGTPPPPRAGLAVPPRDTRSVTSDQVVLAFRLSRENHLPYGGIFSYCSKKSQRNMA